MKKVYFTIIFLITSLAALNVQALESNAPAKVRTVNFKKCVEQSKVGKQEQASFEAIKKQMETVLVEKEKVLNEMAAKFEDPDFLDGLSAEAETELKRKFRALSQEFAQLQQQYVQALQQTNFKIVQKLTTAVSKAATEAAQKQKIDLVVNEENAAFFVSPNLDISSDVVSIMDQHLEKEEKAQDQQPTVTPQTTTPATQKK